MPKQLSKSATTKSILFALILCVSVILTTGCGNGGGDEKDPNTPRPRTEAQPTIAELDKTIKQFTDTERGISFSYPAFWGEPTIETTIDHSDGQTEGAQGKIETVRFQLEEQPPEPLPVPIINLVSEDFQDENAGLFIGFVEDPATDCEFLAERNNTLVSNYADTDDAKEDILELFELNPFACEVGELDGQPALLSYNPVQVPLPPQVEEGQTEPPALAPLPAPVIEYRAELPNSTTYKSVIISYLAFGDLTGTTYTDYQQGTFKDNRAELVEFYLDFIDSLQFSS